MNTKYPSRAAYKLLYGLQFFRNTQAVDIIGRICLDLGCAQGGFVQVLLQEGASKVYAVDVGYGVLDYSLRKDPRVVVRERRNLRYLSIDWLLAKDLQEVMTHSKDKENGKGLFCTCDVSFISAITALESLKRLRDTSQIPIEAMILVKPQFEASQKTEKGIIHDLSLQQELVAKVVDKAQLYQFSVLGSTPVQPKGGQGNQEYMLYIK